MAALGIAIRGYPEWSTLSPWLRTTLPGDDPAFGRLVDGFRTVLRPEAIVVEPDDGRPELEVVATGPNSPTTEPLSLDQLSGRHLWVVGRTPETVRCARESRCLPFGLSPSDDRATALMEAGAVCVVASPDEVVRLATLRD
jgi:hypothetical protein